MSNKVHISSEWLRKHMEKLHKYHNDLIEQGIVRPHHGIVPDLICEILRLRGEEVPAFDWPHFPDFIKH